MPTYEYQCTRCGHVCEEFKPVSAPRRQRCPLCRGKVERLITGGVGVLFKGSGFYVTDSRGKRASESPAASGGQSAAETAKAPSETPAPSVGAGGGKTSSES